MFSICVDDTKEQNHCLFEEYRDPCRAGPGKEKPWVIGVCICNQCDYTKHCALHIHSANDGRCFSLVLPGTLLEQPTLYEEDINTPESLQRYTLAQNH